MSRSFSLNNFWNFLLSFFASGPLVFFVIARPSSLYSPIWFLLMCLLSKNNIKVPINSHTSAPSYAPIVTSKLVCPFLTHGSLFLCKTDFLAWNVTSMSFLVIEVWSLANLMASHNSFYWWIEVLDTKHQDLV